MLKIGIVGLGHLGEIHLKQWLEIVPTDVLFCFDIEQKRLAEIRSKYDVSICSNFQELLDKVDVVDVVTPTNSHFDYASEALKANKHVFIEKPVCDTMEQVDILIELQKRSKTLVQIGHVERYNPAYKAVESSVENPRFFEVHRLAPFNPRGTEVSVIMDLMIHDLDIVLAQVNSKIESISANGVAIVSKTADIANVRLEFENGCVANLTSSRISMKKMRKMRIFSNDGYVSIDFLKKESEILSIKQSDAVDEGVRFTNNENEEKKLVLESYNKLDENAIHAELQDFYRKICQGSKNTQIDLISASFTLDLALKIQEKI